MKKKWSKYIFSIRRENEFEERFYYMFTKLEVFSILFFVSFLFFSFCFFLFKYTPLQKHVASEQDKQDLFVLHQQLDSLENEILMHHRFSSIIQSILRGDQMAATDASAVANIDSAKIALEGGLLPAEQDFVDDVEMQFEQGHQISFVSPLIKGVAHTSSARDQGVDVFTDKQSSILTIAEGTVLSATQTDSLHQTIIFQHKNTFVSVYKNVKQSTVVVGNQLQAGDEIGSMGTWNGKHGFYLELWQSGEPLDPLSYLPL